MGQSGPLLPALQAAAGASAGSASSSSATTALQSEMSMRSRFMGLFTDECFLPALLEFMYQEEDVAARVEFLKVHVPRVNEDCNTALPFALCPL